MIIIKEREKIGKDKRRKNGKEKERKKEVIDERIMARKKLFSTQINVIYKGR